MRCPCQRIGFFGADEYRQLSTDMGHVVRLSRPACALHQVHEQLCTRREPATRIRPVGIYPGFIAGQPVRAPDTSTPTGSSPGNQLRLYRGDYRRLGSHGQRVRSWLETTHPGPLHTAGFLLKPATAAGWPQWPAGSQHPRLLRRQPSRHAPGCGSRRPAPQVGFLHRRSQEC